MKNKLLVCFRPVTIETDDSEPINHADNHRDSKPLTVTTDRKTKVSKARSSFSDKENMKIRRHSRHINDSSRKFCQDLKSILVEASLQKQRACDGNVGQTMIRSKSHNRRKSKPKSSEANSMAPLSSCPRSFSERKPYRPSSYNNTSLSLSWSGPLSRSFSQKRQSISEDTVKSSNSGLFVFAMTLCITIMWGRVCAIMFTSILFYFLTRRTGIDRRPEDILELPEIDKEYKKRVIIEGAAGKEPPSHRSIRAINFDVKEN